ncbi:MAG: DUF1553 domain-containing protein, partial [Planctomycetaceae bacterium]|nr:DUF1553 domain-containing protein [Planctomycetaceae bacterium]
GDAPTHPELLDWLATELVDCHWSLKSLHRMIVTSSVYRTASRPEPSSEESQPERHAVWSPLIEADPSNQWLGRMRRRRLEGEAIRDAMLSVSGMLNREEHGPGVRPLLAAEVTSTLLKNQWPVTPGVDQHSRRSIYLFARRNLRYPLFEVFDKPDPNLSCSRRSETTIAPQALHLLNSDFAIECAERLADRIRTTHHDSADQIETCYRLVYGRSPEDHERADAAVFLREGTDAASLTDFCLALFNTNEFVYID